MCIVCGPGASHLLRALIGPAGARRPQARRLMADAVAPNVTPPLDPADERDLSGPADVILRGGRIVTVAGPEAEAVALRAGRVQAVGSAAAALAHKGRATRLIDLNGRVLIPGFVVAHWHFPVSLLCGWVDADAPRADIAAALAGADAAVGEWVVARVSDDAPRLPSPAALAAARPDNPVVLVDSAGIVLAATDRVGSDAGVPLSALLPRMAEAVMASGETLRGRLARLLREAVAQGVTTLRLCGLGTLSGVDDLALFHAVAATAKLRLRATLDGGLWSEWRQRQLPPGFGDDMARVDAVTAWPDTDEASLREAHRAGWPVIRHADEPAAWRAALDGFSGWTDLDARSGLETRDGPDAALLREAAQAGLSLGLTGPAIPAHGDVVLSLGQDRMDGPPLPLRLLSAAPAALPALTRAAARRCGMPDVLGCIARGSYADFAVLDLAPGEPGAACVATWVHGREVWRG